jgi:hypothetical protein
MTRMEESVSQDILRDMIRWQSEPVEWLDKELAWLMSDKKSALCRMSEDDILRSSQLANCRFKARYGQEAAQEGSRYNTNGKVGFGGF